MTYSPEQWAKDKKAAKIFNHGMLFTAGIAWINICFGMRINPLIPIIIGMVFFGLLASHIKGWKF